MDKTEEKQRKLDKPTEKMKVAQAAVTLEHTGLALACNDGFKVFQFVPPVVRLHKNFVPDVGPVRLVRAMGSTQYVVYVSAPGGKCAQNVVMIYNSELNRNVYEVTVPTGVVTNIQLSHTRLAVFTANRLFIYELSPKLQQIRMEEIRKNPTGISAMSHDASTNSCFLAYPAFKQGSVQILDVSKLAHRESKSPISIEAHKSEITQVALNGQGTLLATGSQIGTVIRVFDVRSRSQLYELRRGTSAAHLKCLAFSPCSCYLGVASDKGTLHVFGIRDAEPSKNKNVLERNLGSSSILHIPLDREVLALGFSRQTTKNLRSLIAICSDGTYWQHQFSKDNQGKVHHNLHYYNDLGLLYEDAVFFRKPP